MKVGMNLLLWTTHVTAEHDPLLARLAELGFDGVELPLGDGDPAHYAAIGKRLDGLGLGRTTVTSLTPETNPLSPDAAVRDAAVDRLKWAIDCAHALGAEAVCGPFHSAYKVFSGSPPTDAERERAAGVLRAAAEYAETAGVRLAIEALNRFECYLVTTMAQARDLVARVDHPALGVHYDTHHMHIEEKDVAAAIQRAGSRITHVHVSENDRGVPGRGQVRWAESFEALHEIGYDGWLTVEAFSTADPGFASAIHVWRDFDPSDEIAREGLAFTREGWMR
ncbi:MAG: sugar phosphate isomerase/epimerase [bacterium]|nr:sugar phosphate isomerase/epimerase [bacterium]